MKFEDFYDFVRKPGIYYFKNTVNCKYYIGQAQDINDRIRKHRANFERNYFADAHLYRAWRKYGIEAFEVGVLEVVDLPQGDERNKKLDELEIKYIKEYNSYGTGGYNQTLGGDGGICGYKFTDLQKERLRINSLKTSLDGRYKVYFYDTLTKQYGEAPSFQIISDIINPNTSNVFREEQISYFGRFVVSHSKENLKIKIQKFYSDYYYSRYETVNIIDLQKEIDDKVESYKKEISEFFEKYGYAKYNRKDNKTKKEEIRKLQKEDLKNGISKEEYKEKYNIKNNQSFFRQVDELYPEWEPLEVQNYNGQFTEQMKADIIDGMCYNEFNAKYKVSSAIFIAYKRRVERELNIKIKSNIYRKPGSAINEEQERDLLNNIDTIEYMRKYNVSETTVVIHRRIIKEKYPDFEFKTQSVRKVIDKNLIKQDILNGISKREFSLKYNLSESSYKKYKKMFLGDGNKKLSTITDEMEQDIRNGITPSEYKRKYNISESTFYKHRKSILKQEDIKYNYVSLENVITEEKRNDLLNGMDINEYIKKYNCGRSVYYKHRKYVIPDDEQRLSSKSGKSYQRGINEEQKQDILNGMSEKEFLIKHNISGKTYWKYRKLLTNGEEVKTIDSSTSSASTESKEIIQNTLF